MDRCSSPSGLQVTIDGYNWNSPPSGSDTSNSVTQRRNQSFKAAREFWSSLRRGHDQRSNALRNNAIATNETQCGGNACGNSIDVQSLITGPGDQGESNVTISNNLIVNTGGGSTAEVGTSISASADSSKTSHTKPRLTSPPLTRMTWSRTNVFVQDQNFENNGLEMTDTYDALVTGNTVTYPLIMAPARMTVSSAGYLSRL